MRLTKLYMPTLREVPTDAEVESHKLLLRAAMIRRSTTGIYSYLPLGYRVVRKIEQIVREEMDRAGSQEILMSAIQPAEIWEESGRWDKFGPEMFKLVDRNGRDFCLGPTAEEYFTTLVKDEVSSYKQLPLNIYQIQTKYRDEKRPRFGINRAREFLMKDAYSFDKDEEGLQKSYDMYYKAYQNVFDRLSLDYKIVEGDNGAMGGHMSHEFIALSETGEGIIFYSENSDKAYTEEKAPVHYDFVDTSEPLEKEEVETIGAKTIADLSELLNVEEKRCAKAIDLTIEGKPVIVFIPGDRELNMAKLISYLGVPEHEIEFMSDEDIIKIDSHPGYTGPIGLNEDVRVILDKSITKINNLVVGANKKDYHIKNVCYERDFTGEVVEDLLMAVEGDKIPGTDEVYKTRRGIEVGNIFQLGTKYSEALNATFLDENGKSQYFVMGSYGIGVTRSVSAVVEQYHDDHGIVWPMAIAPYHIIITVMNPKKEEQVELGEKLHAALVNMGYEVLLDDRNVGAGVKFNDRDLIGIPLRITVGKKAQDSIVEFSRRDNRENIEMTSKEAIDRVVSEILEESGIGGVLEDLLNSL